MTTCRDLALNEADLKRIGELFLTLRTAATPISLLFPWFPSPARKMVKDATAELYSMLDTYVESRRRADLTGDPIDILIADGDKTEDIIAVSPPLMVV